MENVLYEAGCEKWINKPGFNGLKIFKIEDDVLSLEFFGGRKFSAPLKDLQIRVTTSWKLLWQPTLGRVYKFTTSDGHQFKLGGLYDVRDFSGFLKNVDGANSLFKQTDTIWEIYHVLDSLPNTKNSTLETIELVLSWGIIALIVISIAVGIFS